MESIGRARWEFHKSHHRQQQVLRSHETILRPHPSDFDEVPKSEDRPKYKARLRVSLTCVGKSSLISTRLMSSLHALPCEGMIPISIWLNLGMLRTALQH